MLGLRQNLRDNVCMFKNIFRCHLDGRPFRVMSKTLRRGLLVIWVSTKYHSYSNFKYEVCLHFHVFWLPEALMYVSLFVTTELPLMSPCSHVISCLQVFKTYVASAQQWQSSYSHFALPSFTGQTFWSVPNQPFQFPSSSLPPSIFPKRTVTNLFECGLRQGPRDGWADRGDGGLVSGMVSSRFTAYISHILADCWWKRMGLREIVCRGLGSGGGHCVWNASMSIRMC